jgi:hypothetical protein
VKAYRAMACSDPYCEMPGCTFKIAFVGVTKAIGPFKVKQKICEQHAYNLGLYVASKSQSLFRHRREIRRVDSVSRDRSVIDEYGDISQRESVPREVEAV